MPVPPLVLASWLAGSPAAAQAIGTWSAQRSPYPLTTSDHFDDLRARIQRDFPRAQLVPLHTIPSALISQLDVLILDGQGTTPLSAEEQAAVRDFVTGGGILLAQGLGPVGASIAAPFGVTQARGYDGEEPLLQPVPAGFADGPFGTLTRFANRYDGHFTVSTPGAVTVGDANGAHLVSIQVGEGRAVFFGNLFALADADFAPGGLFGSADNAALVSNLIALSLPAPRIGSWALSRSEVGFARSPAFDVARAEIAATLPGARLVELERLDLAALSRVDVVVIDSTIKAPLTITEFDALADFVRGGGSVVAHLYGTTGNAIAGLYGLAVRGSADPSPRVYQVQAVAAPPLSGLFGPVSTFENRYEVYVTGRGTANDGIPLVSDAGGARLVYVPPAPRHGSALLVTNLFAFGDPDWSAGGFAGSTNNNLALLGNFLASAVRGTTSAPTAAVHVATPEADTPAWVEAYREAALTAVGGDLRPLEAWLARYRDEDGANAVVLRTAAWLDAPQADVDARFFPTDRIVLGVSTRKDLKAQQHQPNSVSKWTFDVGDLGWTCLEGPRDYCYEVTVGSELPAAWAAAGLGLDRSPEQLAAAFEGLGYEVTIGVSSVSPFGRQVVARGFGVLWQVDYTHQYQGEELIDITARRVPR